MIRSATDAKTETPAVRNVLGGTLRPCSTEPMTGFYRDGCCNTGPADAGSHTVCAVMNAAFLQYTAERGNNLSTPRPEMRFPGLKPGDRWCLCAARWREAYDDGVAPDVVLEATHLSAADAVGLDALREHAAEAQP